MVPSVVVAVIVAVPELRGLTTPSLLTVATVVLLLVHATPLFMALSGKTVAVRVALVELYTSLKDNDVLSSETPVAPIVTVTAHDALKLVPSVVVAVTVALPFALGVTMPFSSTVTTAVLLLLQATLLLDTLSGAMLAVSCCGSFKEMKDREVSFNDMPVATFTVTIHVALRFVPSVVAAVIVAVPFFFGVTTPELSTVATAVLLLVQSNILFSA